MILVTVPYWSKAVTHEALRFNNTDITDIRMISQFISKVGWEIRRPNPTCHVYAFCDAFQSSFLQDKYQKSRLMYKS